MAAPGQPEACPAVSRYGRIVMNRPQSGSESVDWAAFRYAVPVAAMAAGGKGPANGVIEQAAS
jgi:hypothetical protein